VGRGLTARVPGFGRVAGGLWSASFEVPLEFWVALLRIWLQRFFRGTVACADAR
jgi:hypothetical protein